VGQPGAEIQSYLGQQPKPSYNLWGGILADQDNASNALHMYENAITHNAKFAEANVNWANTLLFELSEFAEAIAKYKAALDVNPTLASAHNGWGLALDSLERPDEALTQFDLAIHLDSNDYWPYLNKANILSDTGKRKEALFLYEKARRLVERQVFRAEDEKNSTLDRSHYTDAYQALCAILIGTGDFKGAITIGEESETLDDTDPDAQMCLGKALSNAGRLDDAERHFRRATGLRTRWVSPLNELGNLAMRRGKYDEAETFFRSIVNLEPTYSWGWSNWGRALFAEGKYWQGMLYLYNGAKLHPRGGNLDVEIRYNYLNVGKYAASAERFLHAIKLNGNDPGQHLALAFSLQRR
jgi:tetratricopeptide (TPR) repeat protein